MYTIWEIETQNLWLTQMPSQGEMADRKIFVCLSTYRLLWNNLWSVSRYVWRQSGNDQQCLAAPIWKYRSGFGDHRFTFFIDLRPNYTFYTNLTNIVHWVVAYRDMAHLVRLNLGKSWEKSAKSFDAGLMISLTYSSNPSPDILMTFRSMDCHSISFHFKMCIFPHCLFFSENKRVAVVPCWFKPTKPPGMLACVCLHC